MSKESYSSVGGTLRKNVKKYYVKDGITREIARGYAINDGLTRMFYQNVVGIASAVVTLGAALTYNGSAQTMKLASVVLDGKTLVEGTDYTVSGNTGTNAGSYTLTVTGIGDYEGTVTKAWSIAKLSLAKPTVSGSFTYNGSSRSCTVSGMNSAYITQSGTTSATNAGEYTVTFALKSTSNTQWSDGTTAAVSRTWSIAKATGSISVSPATVDILGPAGTTSTATITYTGDGAISVTSNKTSIATVSRSGNTITVTAKGSGSATITITMAAGTNYTGASCTISANVVLAFGGYSGDYEQLSNATFDGVEHELYRLTGSGTLVLNSSAKVWLCGGGGGGGSGLKGGGGGGGYVNSGSLAEGSHVITIGVGGGAAASGGATTVGTELTANPGSGATDTDGAAGGSGGGAHGGFTGYGGKGAGVSTYPFGLTSRKAHCAGGAGGTYCSGGAYFKGCSGGTNGGDGVDRPTNHPTSSTLVVANGGVYGGGKGGGCAPTSGGYSGEAASFYGGGGGGAGRSGSVASNNKGGGGAGYPGVVYIAIPV